MTRAVGRDAAAPAVVTEPRPRRQQRTLVASGADQHAERRREGDVRRGGTERVGDRIGQPAAEAGRIGTERRGRIAGGDPIPPVARDQSGTFERRVERAQPLVLTEPVVLTVIAFLDAVAQRAHLAGSVDLCLRGERTRPATGSRLRRDRRERPRRSARSSAGPSDTARPRRPPRSGGAPTSRAARSPGCAPLRRERRRSATARARSRHGRARAVAAALPRRAAPAPRTACSRRRAASAQHGADDRGAPRPEARRADPRCRPRPAARSPPHRDAPGPRSRTSRAARPRAPPLQESPCGAQQNARKHLAAEFALHSPSVRN